MYLEKLEAQGFKSFATKNILVFPGMIDKERRGLTAVVGPNGSGKSNVADAVRWALGEQSLKTLRGKKSEDVIFSGSDKKGKLGMAEVSLYLNNEDKKAPIDFSQIVLTRRLFRNGDSEYLINNSRVRLSDIQMLLAKANFGQKTYSVIGQGMVEGFLNTSLAERKEFFDEATGVKQYQIKRDDSLNKLRGSYENLVQAQMLLTEIEPRLKGLTRQVNRLRKRGELEEELKKLQHSYYAKIWHDINSKFSKYNNEYLELEQTRIAKDKKMESLNRELEQLKIESTKDNNFTIWQRELSDEQRRKDELNRKLSKIEAQLELRLESEGKFDLSFLISKKEELENETKKINEEIIDLNSGINNSQKIEEELELERKKINDKIEKLNLELSKIGDEIEENTEKEEEIRNSYNKILSKLKEARNEENIEKIKIILSEIEEEISIYAAAIKNNGEKKEVSQSNAWQKIHGEINESVQEKEQVAIKISDNKLRISARAERVKLLNEKLGSLKIELKSIVEKINQNSGSFDFGKINEEQAELKKQLLSIDEKIVSIKSKLNKVNAAEEEKRNKLFSLQKELQNLQNEINDLNTRLNDLKIGSTRYETKLEDLEIEIREELGGMKDIKQKELNEEIDPSDHKEKIIQIKKQLELIGGIDASVEQEYNETKERFDFLSDQVNDLTKAITSLESVIKELDIVIKEKFDKEFRVIAGNFQKYFKVLFNGGTAKIDKVVEDETVNKNETNANNTAEEEKKVIGAEITDLKKIKFLQKHNATGLAGIDIIACPPGKRITSVSMLSGGERALTAIALICAIISANPSPFVVLDEVDAALDEANSERLASILDELSHKTQFIVITHNRASMRKANILYGVTMGDDGVSKILSVKLDEVKARNT